MLNDLEILRYTNTDFRLPDGAKAYIKTTRASEPSRLVGTHARSNISSWFTSRKMGRAISVESRTAERAFLALSEWDERIYEIWDQPEPIKVTYTDRRGRVRARTYTPDFLVLGQDGPQVVEVKTLADVSRLAKIFKDDWRLNEDGSALFGPATRAFDQLGLNFRVFVYSSELRYLVSNIELLSEVADLAEPTTTEVKAKVNEALHRQFAWTLAELRRELGLPSYTELLSLVRTGFIHIDMRNDLLTEPAGCVVVGSITLLQEARAVLDQQRVFTDGSARAASITRVPTERDAKQALCKLNRVNSGETGRSARRWKAAISKGKAEGLSEFQALIPKYYRSGNSRPRLGSDVQEVLQEYLVSEHANSPGLSKYRSYVAYRIAAEQAHPSQDPVCQRTFYKRLSEIPAELIARARGGKRAGNAEAAPTDPEQRSIRAQLPWQVASIDHYLADLFVIFHSGDNLVYVERPWITAMIDLYTGAVLAVTISFLSPSKRAVSKIVRECVRLHRRLPLELMVDRGSEFQSTFMASLCAHYGIGYSLRPASHPRFGSEVERFFGEFKQQWLTQRPGNLADYREARSVDGKLAPRKRAVLTPDQCFRELKQFCEWRDNKLRGGAVASAAAMFKEGQRSYPFMGRAVEYDSDFLVITAVETRAYKVDQRRGIHVSDYWYYSPNLTAIRGRKSSVEVRIDPENPHIIYTWVGSEWVPCYSSNMNTFGAKDPNQQLADGLVKLEASALRRRVRLDDDEKLARLVRELDSTYHDDGPFSFKEKSEQAEPVPGFDSIIDELALGDLEDLAVEHWGDPI